MGNKVLKIGNGLKIALVIILFIAIIYLLFPFQGSHSEVIHYTPVISMNDNQREAVIILNTGSPQRLDKASVGQFIGDMLSDSYVMGMPHWFRVVLARKIIAPLRATASLEKYALVWGDSPHSPLTLTTLALGEALEYELQTPTAVAMRYGSPSPQEALADLKNHYPVLDSVTLLPLFPQYAQSSYLTAVEQAKRAFEGSGIGCGVVSPFFDNHHYIKALVDEIVRNTPMGFDKLLFSFHSLPMSHVEQGEKLGRGYDYAHQCSQTARLSAEMLGLNRGQYEVVYTSAMGRNWLKPDLGQRVAELPGQGFNRIAVVSPGFVVDNLETLYDININARQIFIAQGGREFTYVPCLNQRFAAVAKLLISTH